MTPIIMFATLLLLAGTGEAGEPDFRFIAPEVTIECRDNVCRAGDMHLSKYVACYDRMREAMRAVAPLLPEVDGTSESGAIIYRQLQKEMTVPIVFEAIKQWDATMRECVRESR